MRTDGSGEGPRRPARWTSAAVVIAVGLGATWVGGGGRAAFADVSGRGPLQAAAAAGRTADAAPVAGAVLAPYPPAQEQVIPESPTPTLSASGDSGVDQQPTPTQAPGVTTGPGGFGSIPGTALDPTHVQDALRPRLQGGALGPGRTPAVVIDMSTGQVLYRAANRPTVPASTAKLVTAVSVLDALGADAVLRTRTVVLDPAAATRRVVIVGGGDPTLASTSGRVGGAGTSIFPASVRQLAKSTAKALGADPTVRVGYDATLFSGPAIHPTWSTGFPAGGVVAPVSALQVDQGRRTPRAVARVSDPALAAAERFATELERAGVTVTGRIRSTPIREDSAQLASVASPPLDVLVERMLATSDNDIAEALARVAAHAAGLPASFAGVATRARAVLGTIAPDATRDGLVDGSGLSRSDRLSPSTLMTLLSEHRDGALAPGLPVGGATGSLRNRFRDQATDSAAGLARLKTGTLSGVAGLAGFVSRPDGRLLALAFLDGSTSGSTAGARAALDRAVAALVHCRCAADSS